MSSKIDIRFIFLKHLSTLIDSKSGKVSFIDHLTFHVFPAIFAAIIVCYKVFLDKDAVSILCTCLSIFVGLFFNVIVLIFDMIKRDGSQGFKNELLSEILSNISFSIALSIICILISFATLIQNENVKIMANWLTYTLSGVFFLNVIMILKRTFILFEKEVETRAQPKRTLQKDNLPK